MLQSAVVSVSLWLFLSSSVQSFSAPQAWCSLAKPSKNKKIHRQLLRASGTNEGHVDIRLEPMQQLNTNEIDGTRREFLTKSALVLTGFATPSAFVSGEACAEEDTIETESLFTPGNYDCLLDLPPITPGCARLYLCRHGQTENNRLHLVQGARVDPPLNKNGLEQARRIGETVSRLIGNGGGGNVAGIPSLVAHSKLRRAKETAKTLTSTADALLTSSSSDSATLPLNIFGEIPSLGEVDFGTLEGKDAKKVKSAMRSTFASWSLGNIDKRPPGGEGESGREVFERAANALESLSQLALESSGNKSPSIMAVSHSTYLRVLLSMVDDSPLAQSALWKIKNGSINVVDVNIEGKIREVSLTSGLFGGGVMSGFGLGQIAMGRTDNFKLSMPEATLIRRNEVRHLDGMDV